MCFSLEADLIAGVVVGGVGIDAVAHAREPSSRAIAALPLLLAGHQLTEALVWSGLEGGVAEPIWRGAMWAYLIVAFAILPGLVPMVAASLEATRRRRWMYACAIGGGVVAGVLVDAMVRGPVSARIEDGHIAYDVPLGHGGLVVAAYVAVVAGALLVSSHREVRWFGATNVVAAMVLAWLNSHGFISLWCFWAAITSVAIAVFVRRTASEPSSPASTPGSMTRASA